LRGIVIESMCDARAGRRNTQLSRDSDAYATRCREVDRASMLVFGPLVIILDAPGARLNDRRDRTPRASSDDVVAAEASTATRCADAPSDAASRVRDRRRRFRDQIHRACE